MVSLNGNEDDTTMTKPRHNYICNFRAPDREHYQIWENFKESAHAHGLDICFLTLKLCQAWLSGVKETKEMSHQITTATQVINLQQQNTFVYSVQKPRRSSTVLICSRRDYSRTITRLALQAYVMEKARDLQRSFSFRDFLELGHNSFRKCVLELKKRKKIVPLEPRTNPRFYVLCEWLSRYPTMSKNNGVKPKFTRVSTGRGE